MRDSAAHMILAAVERLQVDSCGAFLVEVDGDNVGSVFVERNRVCWAAHVGLGSRLRDLLREHGDVDDSALRQHTVESLAAFPDHSASQITWIAHRNNGYQPRHTFAPVELLVAVNALAHDAEAIGGELALALSALDIDARAATYVPGTSGGLVAIRMTGSRTTIADLDELGAWADAAFGATRGFSRAVMMRAIAAAHGEMYVAWQSSRTHTHAAVLEGAERVAQLVSRLERRELPTIISRRARRSPEQLQI